MKYIFVIIMAVVINHGSFAKEPPKGNIIDSTYTYEKTGWSFVFPDGWSIRSASEIARVRGIGKQALEEMLSQDVPLTPTPLLYLHNGKRNRFTSDAVIYDQSPNDYEDIQDQLNSQIQELFKSKGLNTDNTKSKQNISGVKFIVYGTNILSPNGGKVLAKSIIFTALINNIDFTMSYTCVDKIECKKIQSSILKSTFSHK